MNQGLVGVDELDTRLGRWLELAALNCPLVDVPEVRAAREAFARGPRADSWRALRDTGRTSSRVARTWARIAAGQRGRALDSPWSLAKLWEARAQEDAHACAALVAEVWADFLRGVDEQRVLLGICSARVLLAHALGYAEARRRLGPVDGALARCFPGPPVSRRYAFTTLHAGLVAGDAVERRLAAVVGLQAFQRSPIAAEVRA